MLQMMQASRDAVLLGCSVLKQVLDKASVLPRPWLVRSETCGGDRVECKQRPVGVIDLQRLL